jgi:uncharacterized membrane protein YtjA (UPF0391 family)
MVRTKRSEEYEMLNWGLIFVIVALIGALLGFTGVADEAAGIAKAICALFLMLFVLSRLTGLGRKA